MRRYVIRCNPGTGGWIMYYLERSETRRPIYRIMGWACSQAMAMDGVYE